MKIDNQHYCDYCCVGFEKDSRSGRLYAGRKKVEGFRGPIGVLKFAVHALFGTLLCEDCDNTFSRKAAPKIPMDKKLRKYLKGVESGDSKAPWTKLVIKKNGNNMCVPIKLTAEGRPAK